MKKDYIRNLFTRVLLSIIIFLVLSIFVNISSNNLLLFKKYCYNQTFNFAYINNLYKKYLGSLPLNNIKKDQLVTNEVTIIKNKNKYYDGVKLEVDEHSNIKSIESGIVVFLGEKENYGNTIIIQGSDGIDYWYSNLDNISIKLYDYIEKDTILGTNKDNYYYMVFSKNGEYLDYENFIKD